ncbi:MAG: 2-dehydropantoate 2-reductase [Magnetococcales bacterium]|nr:2-dehydropantoate 2-reductase [Magnetococcales bacterium]
MKQHDTPPGDKHPEKSQDPPSPPTVLIVGTGAVGGFYGAALARAGAQVTTVHRSDFDTVRQHGIHIDSLNGSFLFRPYRVTNRVEACDTPDFLLVAMKALPGQPVAEIIRPAVGPNTVIIMVQNGLGAEEPVQQAFPNHEIIAGLAFVCLQRTTPGHIQHLCHGKITLGRHPEGISPAVRRLESLFQAGGVPCQVTDSPARARWTKLVWNAAFNPVSVLAGDITTHAMLALPEGEKLIRTLMQEVIGVARALGHPLPDTLIDDHLAATRSVAPYHTTMAQDHMAGRRMELDAILGAAIKAAHSVGSTMPLLENIFILLKLLERKNGESSRNQCPNEHS